MRIWGLWPVAALLLGSGCASMAYKAKAPNLGGQCADDLRNVAALPLRHTVTTDKASLKVSLKYTEFASIAHCYRPADAEAMAVALYRLDGVSPPSQLSVSVLLSPGGTFASSVEVLDAQYRPLQRYGFERFVRRGAQYSLNVFLNPSDQGVPAYLLLAPDRGQVGKVDTAVGSQTNAMPIVTAGVMFTFVSGTETQVARPFVDGGQVRVTSQPQSSASFDD